MDSFKSVKSTLKEDKMPMSCCPFTISLEVIGWHIKKYFEFWKILVLDTVVMRVVTAGTKGDEIRRSWCQKDAE